jgi:hypothetical protein
VAPYRRSLTFIAILFALVFSSAANFTHNYVVLGEGLSLEPLKYLGRTVDAVESRIRAWEVEFAKRRIEAKRVISAPYGSAFLKFNKKGLDQDYMCVFDLGVLQDAPSNEQAAELIAKLNNFSRVITAANGRLPRTPALYVYDNGPVDKEGKLKLDAKARAMIAGQIETMKTGATVRLAFSDDKGRLVPADNYPFQIVLPLNTRMKIATNTVKYYPEMFSGIRDISFQIFFNIGIKRGGEITYLNVIPLYDKVGVPIPLFDGMVKNIFLSPTDADTYKKTLQHLPTKEIVLYSMTDLYLTSLREHEAGDYLKQVKRLHQTYNDLKWAFSPSEQAGVESALIKWLQSDWAIIAADIAEQGDRWKDAGPAMRATFIRAGSLDALVGFLDEAVKLEARHSQIKTELDELRDIINGLKRRRNLTEQFTRLKALGNRISQELAPPEAEIDEVQKLFGAKLQELGFRSVHIYPVRNEKLALLKQELVGAGLAPEKINLPPEQGGVKKVGGYDYTVIDKLGNDEKPVKTILFRSVFTGTPAEKFRQYYQAIPAGSP